MTVRSPIRRKETEKCHNLHRMCAWHNMHCKDRRTKIECVKTKHKLATLHESSKLLKSESMDHQWSPWTIVWEKHIQLWSILVSLRCSHDGGLKGSSTAYRTAFAEFETHWEAPTIAYIAKRQKVVQEKVSQFFTWQIIYAPVGVQTSAPPRYLTKSWWSPEMQVKVTQKLQWQVLVFWRKKEKAFLWYS